MGIFRVASRTKYKIGTFLAINIVLSLLLILIGFVHYYIFIIIIAIAMGMITVYGMSITYTLVRYLARRDLVSLTLSFVNTLQLLVAVAVPIIFTIIVSQYNYELAWVSMGILGLIFVPLIFLAKGNLIKVVPS